MWSMKDMSVKVSGKYTYVYLLQQQKIISTCGGVLLVGIQWKLYIKTTIGTNKMWSLYTGGLYMQVQKHGKYTPGDL